MDFGVASKESCVLDLFFGIDYHSHLGTRREEWQFMETMVFKDRFITFIKTRRFELNLKKDIEEFEGNLEIGCISDNEAQLVAIDPTWDLLPLQQ